jgi:5'-nucleotidase
VDVLKLDIPASATLKTPWKITHLSRKRYYEPLAPNRKSWSEPGKPDYRQPQDFSDYDPDSDVYVLRTKKYISVTPLSLDLTSRTDFKRLKQLLEYRR